MRLNRTLRIAAERWFSKDHRDFQTVGRLTAWLSRRLQPAPRPALLDDQGGPRLPVLSRIVGIQRDGATLHVELVVRHATLDGRPLVHARDAASAGSPDGTPALPDRAGEAQTLTVTLLLN
jgi:hypothetical protein